jgi:O-antigen/teichoic acid export membrane protein
MSHNRTLFRGASASLAIQLVNVALAYAVTAILTRALSLAQFGVYSFILALVTILVFPASAGIPTLLVREMARARAQEDYSLMKGLIRRSHQFVGLTSLALICVTGLAAVLWPRVQTVLPTLVWGLALLPLTPFAAVRGGLLRGLGEVLHGQWPEQLLKPALFLVLVLAATVSGLAMTSATTMALNAISTALALVAGVVLFFRVRPAGLDGAVPRFETRQWLASMVPFAIGGGMVLLNAQIAIMLLGMLGAAEDVGLYRAASQVAQLCALGYMAAVANLGPRFAAAHATGARDTLQRTASLGALFSVATCAPLALVFVAAGQPLLGLMFGPHYAIAWPTLTILSLAQLGATVFGCAAIMLNMTGHERGFVACYASGLAAQGLLCLLLVPAFGATGAAIGAATGTLVPNALLWWMVRRRLGVNTAIWSLFGR